MGMAGTQRDGSAAARRNERRQQTDGATAKDEDLIAFLDRNSADRMNGDRQRLGQDGRIEVEALRQRVDRAPRHQDGVGEAAMEVSPRGSSNGGIG